MDSSLAKTMAVVGIIFGCFATFFPRIISPLFMALIRRNNFLEDEIGANSESQMYPPNPGLSFHQRKMGVHPGMHAASEMRKYMEGRQKAGQVQGSGVFSVVLPLYAVGIVFYLVYTLAKLFSKKSENKEKDIQRYEDKKIKEQVINKQKQLEKLLLKAEQESIGEDEMSVLRRRLEDTEKQMKRILNALEDIQLQSSSLQNMPLGNSDLESEEEEDDDDYREEEDEDDDEEDEDDDEEEVENYNDEYSFLQNQVPKKFTLKNYKEEKNDNFSKKLNRGQNHDDKENQYNIQEINLKNTSEETRINNEHKEWVPNDQTLQEIEDIIQDDLKDHNEHSHNTLRKRKPLNQ